MADPWQTPPGLERLSTELITLIATLVAEHGPKKVGWSWRVSKDLKSFSETSRRVRDICIHAGLFRHIDVGTQVAVRAEPDATSQEEEEAFRYELCGEFRALSRSGALAGLQFLDISGLGGSAQMLYWRVFDSLPRLTELAIDRSVIEEVAPRTKPGLPVPILPALRGIKLVVPNVTATRLFPPRTATFLEKECPGLERLSLRVSLFAPPSVKRSKTGFTLPRLTCLEIPVQLRLNSRRSKGEWIKCRGS